MGLLELKSPHNRDSGRLGCDLVRLGATWCDLVFVRLDAVLGHLNKILPAGNYVLETHVL